MEAALFHYVGPLRPSCPTLLVVHDVSFRLYPQWLDRRARMVLNALVPAAVRRSRLVIAVSHAAKEDIVATFAVDPERVRVIRTHPDPVFSPRPDADRRVRERFGLERYVLAVGDVNPRKNLPALAEAVRRLGDPDLELALVGRPGRDGQAILAECRGRWLGEVTDEELADLYTAATVTCYPSLYEGLGIPVLEAMACGSPVVASRRGAIPEAAGEAAVLVEPAPDAIAEGLRAALEPATRDRLATAGPQQAATFSAQATGEAGWAAFREAAA
jgi:glycosyltransferase involved in cell wall biosynthesis